MKYKGKGSKWQEVIPSTSAKRTSIALHLCIKVNRETQSTSIPTVNSKRKSMLVITAMLLLKKQKRRPKEGTRIKILNQKWEDFAKFSEKKINLKNV